MRVQINMLIDVELHDSETMTKEDLTEIVAAELTGFARGVHTDNQERPWFYIESAVEQWSSET